ncbi:MAG: 5'/3'-nucleotidase SurE, partial [Bacteroidota bacterium]|nr:5'/3'-nucleotidase SurE [Bacteroidota bacterium]
LALDKVVDRKPQLLVSGINHGSNASINVLYSGTMSAAVEGAIDGLNAIGFSLCDYSFEADFEASKTYVRKIAKNVLLHGLPKDTLLNVNVPNVQKKDIKGIKICRQARAKWVEEFDERRDPNGRKYFWLTGQFSLLDHDEKTDEWSLKNDYVSVVPVQFDLTAYNALKTLESWDWT